MWLILKIHEMFISQGQSSSHLPKKLGLGLPDSGWSVSGSGCCAGHLCGTSSGWILQNNCSWWFPWSFLWCGSCGCSWLRFQCCWSNWCSGWGCWHWSHWKHSRWGLWCSWGYISAGQHVLLDSIWMMFMDVIMCMSVLASPNDLDQVWAMAGLANDCGSEPEGLGIIEYRDIVGTLACSDDHGIQHSGRHDFWGDLSQLQLGGPCAWSFEAQLFWLLSGRASQLVNKCGHRWVYSCMPTK